MASSLNLVPHIGTILASSDPTAELPTSAPSPSIWKPIQPSNACCRIKMPNAPDLEPMSPPLSPTIRSSLEPNLDFDTESEETHLQPATHANGKGVPVFVMLPLDTVKMDGGGVNRKKAMNVSLMALKSAGVEGVMVDVWWGLVEKEKPGEYNWAGYEELMDMCSGIGLKVQAVMSFHQCGGNVGDSCTIPLPRWVLEEMEKDPDLAYTDQEGRRNLEYISLGCDTLPVLKGRTPIQCYTDFMRAFKHRFQPHLGSTIIEIQVGMGPAGELRYPSYPESNGTWKFPGVGAFQCYDKYMKSTLKAAADSIGRPEWGNGGPTDAGSYNSRPEDVPFFRHDGGWDTDYGRLFLAWYSDALLAHADRVLQATASVFDNYMKLSVKVAGVHWHYGARSHAAELTAGYYNTGLRDGYLPIARALGRHGAVFNFTCVEMRDTEQLWDAACRPEELVRQVAAAAEEAGVGLAGENALPRYDGAAHDKIVETATEEKMCAFTYLRLSPELFRAENWKGFVGFVKRMGGEKEEERCRELVEREAEEFVRGTVPLVQEAAVTLMS